MKRIYILSALLIISIILIAGCTSQQTSGGIEQKVQGIDCSKPENYNVERVGINYDVKYNWYPSLSEVIFVKRQYTIKNTGCTMLEKLVFDEKLIKNENTIVEASNKPVRTLIKDFVSLRPGESTSDETRDWAGDWYGFGISSTDKAEYGKEGTNDIILKERGTYKLLFQVRKFSDTKILGFFEKNLELT